MQIENDVLFLDASGNIHRLSTTQDIGDVLASSISEASEIGTYVRANVSFTNLRRSIGVWYGIKRKAYFMLPPVGSLIPSIRLMVDMTYGLDRPRFLTTLRDIGTSLWLRPDSSRARRPILGDSTGFAWQLDRDQRNKDGADYSVEFETSETDFAFADPQIAGHVKQNAYLEITADVIQTVTLQVTPIWDNIEHTPVVFTLGSGGAALDAFTLDINALAASGNVVERKQILGSGRRFRFKLRHTTGANVDMRLADFRLDFTLADERVRK